MKLRDFVVRNYIFSIEQGGFWKYLRKENTNG